MTLPCGAVLLSGVEIRKPPRSAFDNFEQLYALRGCGKRAA